MTGTVHMIKMAAGLKELSDLKKFPNTVVHTANTPKRVDELTNGGSLYRVFASRILCRQRILRIEENKGGPKGCRIILDPEIVPVANTPKRAFQGWRYLNPEDAPRDVPAGREGEEDVPEHIARMMSEMGLF